MQTAFTRVRQPVTKRLFSCVLPMLFIAGVYGQAAIAQPAQSSYESVVLVLKLVSATHVRPVTGIVLSDDGLVLVPADFVSSATGASEGEFVALDGGTDILSHGRPAKVLDASIPGGLAILSVEGLQRPGIVLADIGSDIENPFHLAAFPPAKLIASGADPLWEPVDLEKVASTGLPMVSAETPLPYVTGPILDDCGYLAGMSLTSGAQSLDKLQNPVTLFASDLVQAFETAQIKVPMTRCEPASRPVAGTTNTNSITKDDMARQPSSTEASDSVIAEQGDEVKSAADVSGPEIEAVESIATVPNEPVVHKTPDRPSIWRSIPGWLILSSLIVLGIAAWKIITFIRLHSPGSMQSVGKRGHSRVQPASDEPETAQLQAVPASSIPGPRSGDADEAVMPDIDNLPPDCNAVMVLAGQLDPDTHFKRFCAVNAEHFDIVIGRGEADISIEHPAISRRHARLENDGEFMTLSDLGSRNGTFIGSVPCLNGEIMYFEPADEIFLGDVRFYVALIKRETGLS